MLNIINDKYNGVVIEETSLPETIQEFETDIYFLLSSITNKKLMWISIPIEKSTFIPHVTSRGFVFHHCDETKVMLVKKITDDAVIPTSKNFMVGVGAIVFHNGALLVVKDRLSKGYKLPGGQIDKNESLKNALKREVFEETGIDIAFESIINVGHFRNGQFGESNVYIVCTAKALTHNITINDSSEIIEARWINPKDFLASKDVNNYNKSVVNAALTNKELKLTEQNITLRTAYGEVFF